jgi:pilus assembly protein CpaB
MKQRIVLIVSVLAGLAAAILTRVYMNALESKYRDKDKGKAAATADVLVYSRNIPGGAALTKDNVGVRTVHVSGIEGRYLVEADFAKVENVRVKAPHATGEVLFWTDLEDSAAVRRGLSGTISHGMRAVSVNASGAASVSGMVRPGDHVDVIGTFTFPGQAGGKERQAQTELVTMTVLQNVTVLATGSQTASDPGRGFGGSGGYSTVTLLVTPREAEVLVFAEQIRGRLALSLRSPSDNTCEKELPTVDFEKIRSELEDLNSKRNKDGMR